MPITYLLICRLVQNNFGVVPQEMHLQLADVYNCVKPIVPAAVQVDTMDEIECDCEAL
jgi:hypothetical protein